MKKLLLLTLTLLFVFIASAQNKIKVKEGLYLVSYGKTVVIEDDVNQRTISMTISQEQIDQKNGEAIYKVACGQWTRTVIKHGLKGAVKAGLEAASVTGTTSLIISASAELATYIYDFVCDYYKDEYGGEN